MQKEAMSLMALAFSTTPIPKRNIDRHKSLDFNGTISEIRLNIAQWKQLTHMIYT